MPRRRNSYEVDDAVLFNQIYLLEAAQRQHREREAYEELKRLIVFAGIFFMFVIIFVLLKFQISLEDVFKWSPIVWLVGVVTCGLLMNVFLQLRKWYKRRQAKRLREQQNLLYSLNLPSSFPCLAPPPHDGHCCRFSQDYPVEEGIYRPTTTSSTTELPSYDQVMHGVRTWLLSKASFANDGGGKPLPPTYSITCLNDSNETYTSLSSQEEPPPAYDEPQPSTSTAESSNSPRSDESPSGSQSQVS